MNHPKTLVESNDPAHIAKILIEVARTAKHHDDAEIRENLVWNEVGTSLNCIWLTEDEMVDIVKEIQDRNDASAKSKILEAFKKFTKQV